MSNILCDESDVADLPDGSIISWFRIEGDRTSEAIALVHTQDGTTWVSPGGWEPLPLSAIENYPVELIRLGESLGVPYLSATLETPFSDPDQDRRANAVAMALDFARDRGTFTAAHPGYKTVLEVAHQFDSYISDGRETDEPRFGADVAKFLRRVASSRVMPPHDAQSLHNIADVIEADLAAAKGDPEQ